MFWVRINLENGPICWPSLIGNHGTQERGASINHQRPMYHRQGIRGDPVGWDVGIATLSEAVVRCGAPIKHPFCSWRKICWLQLTKKGNQVKKWRGQEDLPVKPLTVPTWGRFSKPAVCRTKSTKARNSWSKKTLQHTTSPGCWRIHRHMEIVF